MTDHFFTINTNGTGLYKEKGSKFYAFAFAVQSKEQVAEEIATLRKTYHDARHFCYAYIIGNESELIRANDDGEPGHSAGDPILGQIKSANLTNTLVIVVRYFGGTKLGVGGLINAYKTSAEEALSQSRKVKEYITSKVKINYSYNATNEVMKLIDKYELKIIEQEFLEACSLEASIIVSNHKNLIEEVQFLQDTNHDIKLI